ALGERIDAGFSGVKDEIKATREDLASRISVSAGRTEEFHTATIEKFEYLDIKYGEFSRTLSALEKDVQEMKDAFLRLVDHVTGEDSRD
ncbi:MAG: hypothetical protein J7L61_02880, partial [Thermoplasmata archaeon]|nr:hypothetical protein [Thermoplasmata archaeon]